MSGSKRHKNTPLARAQQCLAAGRWAEAERFFQQAAKGRAELPTALAGLANALRRQGKHDEARKTITAAVARFPDNADCHAEAGLLAMTNRQPAQAEASLRQALTLDPAHVRAAVSLSQLYLIHNDLSKARAVLTQARSHVPDNNDLTRECARLCAREGMLTEAAHLYAQAARIDPSNPDLLFEYATILRVRGDHDQAIEHFKRAIDLKPSLIEAKAGLADSLESLGLTDEAQAVVDNCMASKETHPALADIAGRIAKRTGNISATLQYIDLTLARTRNDPGSRSSRAYVLFRAGALNEQRAEYDKAFDCYRQANATYPADFNVAQYTNTIDQLIETFSPANLPSMARSDNDSPMPIFIVGMPRSGTSLVEQILASHPDVHGAGELEDFARLAIGLGTRYNLPTPYPACVRSLTDEQANELAAHHLARLSDISNASPRVTDKLPHNFSHIGLISRLFPGAKIIHCVRHPVDVCLSCYATPLSPAHNYSNRLTHLAQAYSQYRRLMDHWHAALDDTEILDVEYEAVVADQEGWTHRLLEFCDLPWHDECMRFYETKRVTRTASMDQVNQPIYTSSVHRYKNFEKHLGPLIDGLAEWM
ncbi:MAG: sulfotransferase family protein [Planctomycetes bacterium]|nr:sulfotransferase family protein [Planctomycetota bacterium]NOG53628.1 tetratricopeptide repeat protein [Planctomycetota bacterium]